ncbi:MAG: hypothetical protein KDI19_15745, partial [Pseudomonadales bacterium]|nr:hypothetical protein [Pseudomonadales bacterium]
MTINLESLATRTLELMDKAGFDDAQVVAAWSLQDELSIFQNEPSLLRTTEDHQLSIAGIVDGRRATTTLTDIEEGAVQAAVAQLLDNARMSPRDDANAVSEDQVGSFTDGPLECDPAILREKVAEMLDF